MGIINDLISNIAKGSGLLDRVTGYVNGYVNEVKAEIRGDVAAILSKAAVYAVLLIYAILAKVFFLVGLALYINTFFDQPYVGYWVVSFLYLVALLILFFARNRIVDALRKRVVGTTKNRND